MNIVLLRMLRVSKSRFIEEESKAGYRKGVNALLDWLKIYEYALSVPILWKAKKGVLIHSVGDKGSKSFEAFKELSQIFNNSDTPLIVLVRPRLKDKLLKFSRLFFVIFYNIPLWYRLFKIKNLSRLEKSLVLGFVHYKRLFRNNSELYPVIISDVNPVLNLMAISSLDTGCIWWQDDFHHKYQGGLNVVKAFVLNSSEFNRFLERDLGGAVFFREKEPIKQVKVPDFSTKLNISVAVNGLFSATESEVDTLSFICRKFDAEKIDLRLHPTARVSKKLIPDFVNLVSPSEAIEKYAKNYDLIIVGNSAVQLKILAEGTPVVHVGGLDPEKFDLYGYCDDGVVLGFQSVKDFDVEECFGFYNDMSYLTRLRDIME